MSQSSRAKRERETERDRETERTDLFKNDKKTI